jgi:hypothetical protein
VTFGWQLRAAGAVDARQWQEVRSSLEDAIRVSAALQGQKKYVEAIDFIQRALVAAPPEDFARRDTNREGPEDEASA